MRKIALFLVLAVLFAAGPSYAQNDISTPSEDLVYLSHQHEALSGLIASLNSQIQMFFCCL